LSNDPLTKSPFGNVVSAITTRGLIFKVRFNVTFNGPEVFEIAFVVVSIVFKENSQYLPVYPF
jgi:hypothetical protein